VAVLSLLTCEQKVVWGTALLAAYSLGHVVLLFAAGAVSGFATAYLGSRAATWATWLHRVFGAAPVAVGAWVFLAPIVSALKP